MSFGLPKTLIRTVLATAFCTLGLTSVAHADGLYFQKVAVKTTSESTCLRFARDVARTERFQNVHQSQAEVAGTKNGAYVAITCVGRGQQNAIAVVMAMAPNFEIAKQMGQVVADKVRGIICFDLPC